MIEQYFEVDQLAHYLKIIVKCQMKMIKPNKNYLFIKNRRKNHISPFLLNNKSKNYLPLILIELLFRI